MRVKSLAGFCLLALFATTPVARAGDPPRTPMSRTAPCYPELAKRMRVWGEVQVLVTVEPDGAVTHAKAIDGHPLLQPAAESAVLNWRFAPGPKESTFLVAIMFKLN